MTISGDMMGRWLLFLIVVTIASLLGCRDRESASTAAPSPHEGKRDVILATTTSTRDSGLLDELLPVFTKSTGYTVKTIAVGSGRAIAMGRGGEADVLLTHAPGAEREILKLGAVTGRRLVMHNDYVLLGPTADPAGVKGKPVVQGLLAIHRSASLFLSRGDDSGTHMLEKQLWQRAGLEPEDRWYQESGSGMGETLVIANQKDAYTLSDRATYLAHRKGLSVQVLSEGDGELMNPYHVMPVNADRFQKVNRPGGQAFADFLLSEPAQAIIASYGRKEYGQPLFHADGGKNEDEILGTE